MSAALEFKVAGSDSSRVLTIINPFPLKNDLMQTLMSVSSFKVVDCTGDHGFYETINKGKIPVHEDEPHLFKFHETLSKEADKLNLPILSKFLGVYALMKNYSVCK